MLFYFRRRWWKALTRMTTGRSSSTSSWMSCRRTWRRPTSSRTWGWPSGFLTRTTTDSSPRQSSGRCWPVFKWITRTRKSNGWSSKPISTGTDRSATTSLSCSSRKRHYEMSSCEHQTLTRTAWADFKYCKMKTS